MGRYLAKAEFGTLHAGNGLAGLTLAREAAPTLAVLDLMLPRLDGIETCREIRKTSDVPILMLTARAYEAERIEGYALDADDYVVKPFSPRELIGRVKAILHRAKTGRMAGFCSNPRNTGSAATDRRSR